MKNLPLVEETPRLLDRELARHRIQSLPILVLFPHNRCNCRCLMCDIWRIRQIREITPQDLEPHLASLRKLRVRWVVFSGGEPLMHSDLPALCRPLRAEGIRVTLLTAGLLLERQAAMVAENFDDVIVSLDGPAPIHDRIRGVPKAFERLSRGIAAVRGLRPGLPVLGRCTMQKENCRHLRETVDAARALKLTGLSFLAADVTSEAFNRPQGWSTGRQAVVTPDAEEVSALHEEIEALIREYGEEIRTAFISESADKLRRMVFHFQAQHGQCEPVSPRCNAPWVSAVVEADGGLRPCFFHPPLGNLADGPLHEIVNSPRALEFRRQLDVAANPTCRRCVCSLYLPQNPQD